jgi:peptidoglycan/LPS O-acetylase OafA/YrhL
MRDPGSQVGHYFGGLDGLRGIAVITVLLGHSIAHFAPETSPHGIAQMLAQGLTLFFALSGMLIYTPFARDIARAERRVRVRRYAMRRILRIMPVYLVIFLICNFVLQAVFVGNAVMTSEPRTDSGTGMLTDPGLLLLNLSLLQTFVPDALQTGINTSWSLTTELTFYALLPVLAVWLVGRSSRRLALALIPPLVLGVAGMAGRAWAEHMYTPGSGLTQFQAEYGDTGVAVLSRSLLALGDNFALGMLVAIAFVWTQRGELPWWTRRRAHAAGWSLTVLGVVGALLIRDAYPWFTGTLTSVAAAAIILLLVDPTARQESSMLVRVAGVKPLEYVGAISLSVYLWHYPVIVLLSRAELFDSDSVTSLIGAPSIVAAASIALGAITFAWIERPAMTGQFPFGLRRAPS